jgi:diacylglycerol kinase family enzyme
VTVAKGKPWGEPGRLPVDGVIARSDAEARAVVERARRAGEPAPTIGLLGGDLCRTLGGLGNEQRLRSDEAVSYPIDVGSALIDGRLHWFVAHLVARDRTWRRWFVAMNASWLRTWNLGPRAHPGDGLLDTFDARLPLTQLPEVARRARAGAHLPHPAIHERRAGAVQVGFEPPVRVWLDGVLVSTARNLSVRIEPDAVTVVI